MKIECKGNVTFLKVELFGESQHLNPFMINTDQIRYIREYHDTKNAWAIIIGQKMFTTRDLNLDDIQVGERVKIGNTEFECSLTTNLTEKSTFKTFINYNNVLYMRKYMKKESENSEKLDKFAIITVDERIIPVYEYGHESIRSSQAGTPISVEGV
jgi:hypothetical protein